MSFADNWGTVYNRSIQPFTRPIRGLIPAVEEVVKGTLPLVSSLAALDQTDPQNAPDDEKADRYKAFVAGQKPLEKAAARYGGLLDQAIRATDKDVHADVYRQLKVLRKHLDVVVAQVGAHAVRHSKEYTKATNKIMAEINQTREGLRDQGFDDNEIDAELNYLRQKFAAANWPAATKKTLALAAVAVQKIKSNPTPQTYNDEMDHGGRDLTQQMSNTIKLIQDAKCPERLKRELRGLSDYRDVLAQFGNGAKRHVPEDAPNEDVLALVREFSDLIKDMIPYYDKMVKYLAKHKL
jgi:hypothetical protein